MRPANDNAAARAPFRARAACVSASYPWKKSSLTFLHLGHPGKSREVFRGCRPPHPVAGHFIHSLPGSARHGSRAPRVVVIVVEVPDADSRTAFISVSRRVAERRRIGDRARSRRRGRAGRDEPGLRRAGAGLARRFAALSSRRRGRRRGGGACRCPRAARRRGLGAAAHDPAVSAWLDGLRRTARGAASEPGGAAGSSLTGQLAAAVVAGERRSAEGELLLDILAAIGDEGGPADRFGQAVAEARLEAVRELAYGAGHEINNPLANIATRAQSLLPRRARSGAPAPALDDRRSGVSRPRHDRRSDGLRAAPQAPHRRRRHRRRGAARCRCHAAAGVGPRRAARIQPAALAARACGSTATQVDEAIRAIAVNAFEAVDDGGRVVVEAAEDAERGLCHVVIADDGRGMAPRGRPAGVRSRSSAAAMPDGASGWGCRRRWRSDRVERRRPCASTPVSAAAPASRSRSRSAAGP